MRGWPPGTVALPLWNTGVWLRCSYMSSDRIIVDALKLAQSLVGQTPHNRCRHHGLTATRVIPFAFCTRGIGTRQ
jgi:hypothetical protein